MGSQYFYYRGVMRILFTLTDEVDHGDGDRDRNLFTSTVSIYTSFDPESGDSPHRTLFIQSHLFNT